MKIVLLDARTLGELKELECFQKLGEVVTYQHTKPDEVEERIKDAVVVITNKVVLNKDNMKKADALRLICVAATGTNNIDLAYAKEREIAVRNVSGYSTDGVAQHTFALLLYILNHIPLYDSFVKSRSYSESLIFTHHGWSIHEIASMRIGIIGFGAIGQKVASIAQAFGAEVIFYSTSGKSSSRKFKKKSLEELLSTSDVVSIHAPLNEATQNLITYKELKMMKPTSILLNTGRGGIINERDLVKAMDEELIAAAALDVFEKEPLPEESPLLLVRNRDRLVLTPHIAWAAVESRRRLIDGVYKNIETFLAQAKEKVE
jgi:lactate dehydrogenase-like 2-hydroxyacid dehydrogenase